MSCWHNVLAKLLVVNCGMFLVAIPSYVSAALVIPQVPLQTGSDVPANIVFMLDDSGSMEWAFTPTSVYGWCDVSTTGIGLARGRSPNINKQYYNPNVQYSAPPNYPDAIFSAAKVDGYKANSAVQNLNTSFRPTWGSDRPFCGLASSADYYLLDKCSNETQMACYTRYDVSKQSAAQKTNFANWFSYYQNRMMSSKAGIARAFETLPSSMRVGYGQINANPRLIRGVRPFNGEFKAQFFSWLYSVEGIWGTPLRNATIAVGDYFKTDEPYRVNPSVATSELVSCRQNFHVLMTDGGWNDGNISVGDVDGDSFSNTLADVAYKYWKDDLRPNLVNNVPSTTLNPANWQHMVTYGVNLGSFGRLNPDDAKYWPVGDVRWGGAGAGENDPERLDDLLHASVNSKGGFFSAASPDVFNAELTNTLRSIVSKVASGSNLAATTTQTEETNSIFQASFNTSTWSGTLVSRDVSTLSEQWRANFPAHTARKIYTSRANAMIEFKWANLTAIEKNTLKSEPYLNYLRGDRSQERTGSNPQGYMRERESLLGDIAYSSPAYVSAPQNRNYQRFNWAGAGSYSAFLTSQQNRAAVVYVGTNAGMLHAFDANSSSLVRGQEIFAYIPKAFLLPNSPLVSLADLAYEHKFFVDGSPTVGDVYINNAWRSILITSLARGGNSIVALDITNPSNITLLWDLTLPELGMMLSKPVITRLANGKWAAVMPYGYNNSANKNGILIIDIQDGATAAPKKIETPVSANGLGQLEGWDANGDGNTDWFFAGDLNGNIWKFDLSSSSMNTWHVANNNQPLFIAKNKANNTQPITGGITLAGHPLDGKLWLYFGTGKFLETGDSINADSQSWYGITDGSSISGRNMLLERKMTNVNYTNPNTQEARTARQVPVSTVGDLVGKRGWVMDLIDSRERITAKPRLVGNNLVMNTMIPDVNLCNPQGDGWIMAIDPFSGGRLNYNFFDMSRDNKFSKEDELALSVAASGVKVTGMPGEPVFVGDTMLVGDSRVGIEKGKVNLQIARGRMSWREIINQ